MEELLLKWYDSIPRSLDHAPAMSLRNQATYLLKKYTTQEHEVETYVQRDGDMHLDKESRTLVCFKDIICKYRPHLHMGDYWLDIKIIDEQVTYKFYTLIEKADGEIQALTAHHPHLSGGVPCLGSFQGDLATHFKEGNYVQFFSVMKAYLQAYNGRSTYTRGTYYKKAKLWGELHSFEEVNEMFQTEADEDQYLDVHGIAKDPMRWNWPKDLTAFEHIELQGQNRQVIKEYIERSKFPILKDNYNRIWDSTRDQKKVLGYVLTAMKVGELPLYHAFEFVRIMLLSLQAQYEGDMDQETMNKLKKMATHIYDVKTSGNFTINSRYVSRASQESVETATDLWTHVKDYYVSPYGGHRERNRFHESLRYLGHSLSNFIILLRKRSPQLAKAKTYLNTVKGKLNVDDINSKYNIIKKEAYTTALTTLDKERRRFINELNKPEISHIIGADGQGTLFTENL